MSFFLLNVFALPLAHPDAQEHFAAFNRDFSNALTHTMDGEDVQAFELSPEMLEISQFIRSFVLFTAWFYLGLFELLTAGSSLGKKVFSLHTVSSRTGLRPNAIETLSRSLFKALSIAYPPLALQFLPAFFTKQRKAGHDFICHTLVSEPLRTRSPDILKPL